MGGGYGKGGGLWEIGGSGEMGGLWGKGGG